MQGYQHILVPMDFSDACSQVLNRAIELGKQNQARISLIHIVEYLPPMDPGYDSVILPDWYDNEKVLIEQAEKYLQKIADEHHIPQRQCKVINGAPKQEIIRYSEEHQVDLIVIGSHGRHGLQRLLGSTAYPVLHHANCDVLAVRIKD